MANGNNGRHARTTIVKKRTDGWRGRGEKLRRTAERESETRGNDRGMKRETHAIYIPHRHRRLCNERRKGSADPQVVEKSRRSEPENQGRPEEASPRHLRCNRETSKKRTRANHADRNREREKERENRETEVAGVVANRGILSYFRVSFLLSLVLRQI